MEDPPIAPLRMLDLPRGLRDGIAVALAEVPRQRWERAAQQLSERYRADRAGGEAPLARGPDQALGYAAMIMPATYAQLRGAMAAAAARVAAWQPTTLLDLGSGPGTALWAALDTWPSIERLQAWEREGALATLGRALASHGPEALQQARWEQRDLSALSDDGPGFDLVVLGHVLNELSPALRERVLAAAWARTRGMLLIVEPGTSAAFPALDAARRMLLGHGAHTIAPCPHNSPCPLRNDWCHFPQRLRRPPFQRQARGALSEWEDSKYSYAALARFPVASPIAGRIIREPQQTKGYIDTQICTPGGIVTERALKRDPQAFRRAREQGWGDILSSEAVKRSNV
jgi:ribosomal protein RSM22 (predicted rRNA methylase)